MGPIGRDAETVASLSIGDFACGTGILLSAAYSRVSLLYELHGGDAGELHSQMIAHALTGCDVLPSAVHLTASMLAGIHPTERITGTKLLCMPYGKQSAGTGGYALGSLDLATGQDALPTMQHSTPEQVTGVGLSQSINPVAVPNESFDLVIMNPPFIRPTNHEGTHGNVPNPAFAAFGADPAEQKALSAQAKRIKRLWPKPRPGETFVQSPVDGNAGMASHFIALAHIKARPGGTVAMVLPLSALIGKSWQNSRRLWRRTYDDIVVVTIAAASVREKSFSADTDMAECLIVARKSGNSSTRAVFPRPQSSSEIEPGSGDDRHFIACGNWGRMDSAAWRTRPTAAPSSESATMCWDRLWMLQSDWRDRGTSPASMTWRLRRHATSLLKD